MVGMFVRDENAIEPFGGAVERAQRIANAFGTEAAIDEHACTGRFQVRGIAAAAATENGEPNLLHGRERTARGEEAQINFIHTLAIARRGL